MFNGIHNSDSSDSSDESSEHELPPIASSAPLTRTLPTRPINYKIREGGQLPGLTKSHVLEHRKGFPYTASRLGQLGNVKVNVKELRGGNLIVTDLEGNEVFQDLELGERPKHHIYPCIYHLVMSKGIACLESGKYDAEECERAIQAFRRLIEASRLKPHRCSKYNILYGDANIGQSYEFIVYQDPNELVEMLEIAEGSMQAGNQDNTRLRKKSIAILEQLFKTEAIDHDSYVQLFEKFRV